MLRLKGNMICFGVLQIKAAELLTAHKTKSLNRYNQLRDFYSTGRSIFLKVKTLYFLRNR